MLSSKKRLLTGIQSSGVLHVGNYMGALKPFLELYEDYDSLLMIADYHALTSLKNPKELARNTLDVAKDYIAVGLDPKKAILFKQSDVPEHTELAWIFNCLVTVPFLMQSHAYKDKVAKGLEANAGLFTYPMLMASDILLYDTAVVPVGEDQRQHIEYAREAASKFNTAFGQTFIEPKERILESSATLPGTDGKKMSKSYNNTIPLFGTDDEVRAAVMKIVTDSTPAGTPLNTETDVTFALHTQFSQNDIADLTNRYREGNIGYKESKDILVQNILSLITPMREKREALSDDEVRNIIKEGGERARVIASAKMIEVRKNIGVTV
ncbi:tryptophan--tRNA ligase [Patescibacteria group bacterium]|nr:MAG: tryptophan--tRNA ligase [Patescibacteria group bacterium]